MGGEQGTHRLHCEEAKAREQTGAKRAISTLGSQGTSIAIPGWVGWRQAGCPERGELLRQAGRWWRCRERAGGSLAAWSGALNYKGVSLSPLVLAVSSEMRSSHVRLNLSGNERSRQQGRRKDWPCSGELTKEHLQDSGGERNQCLRDHWTGKTGWERGSRGHE